MKTVQFDMEIVHVNTNQSGFKSGEEKSAFNGGKMIGEVVGIG